MKIALLGQGKMGSLIRSLCDNKEIVSIEDADVCIEFSHPEAVVKHVALAMMHKLPIVVGTTGWHDDFPTVEKLVKESKGTLLHGANFSIGMYLFSRLVRHASTLLKDFEVAGLEMHHKSKADRPSGSARTLQKILEERRGAVDPFQSVRIGEALGVHTLFFDGEFEMIECTHRAKNKNGYAIGALQAAAWLEGKRGIFTFEEYMETRLSCTFREPSLRS